MIDNAGQQAATKDSIFRTQRTSFATQAWDIHRGYICIYECIFPETFNEIKLSRHARLRLDWDIGKPPRLRHCRDTGIETRDEPRQ